MREASKAQKRRVGELERGEFPWGEVFKGSGIDIGCGDDPIQSKPWPIISLTEFDLPDGGGDDLCKFWPDVKWDFIHGSQVLEHAIDPAVMLRSWIECLKPGGYIVATVPHFALYEHCCWPSKWNAGHRTAWSLSTVMWTQKQLANFKRVRDKIVASSNVRDVIEKGTSELPNWCISLPAWLDQFQETMGMYRLCRLVDTNYDYTDTTSDQTFNFQDGVECFIEIVLQKHG